MTHRIAFAGFRHGHILSLYALAGQREDVEIVAACEEDAATREQLAAAGAAAITHDSYDALWAEGGFDMLAVGDYYGRRGEIIIRALEAGKHVIADKPVCTSLSELDRIGELARAGGLSVGCMLSMRDDGVFRALREAVIGGAIGEVQTVTFSGQHPLRRGQRPEWYFQPGGQGGTINDIAIHAMDMIPWLTGRRIAEVSAARVWSARDDSPEWFQDGAQMMLRLDNGGGVLGDVSYFAPDEAGYSVPQYWRFAVHGTGGAAETSAGADGVTVWKHTGPAERIPAAQARQGGYFEDFLCEIRGEPGDDGVLTTDQVLASSRLALTVQRAADENLRDLPCE